MAKKQEKAPDAASAPSGSTSKPVTPPAKPAQKTEAGKQDGEKKSPPPVPKAEPAKKAGAADPLADQAKKSFASWTGKVEELKGMSADEIYDKLYAPVLDEERKKFPTKPDVEHHKRALRFFKLKFKQKSVGAGRVKVSGIFYAFRGAIDQVAKRRSEILKDAALNPKKAAKDGSIMTEVKTVDGVKKLKILVDEEGKYVPRDNEEFYKNFKRDGKPVKNPRFGKPLPTNQWSTSYFGLFSIDDDEPQLAFFQMRGPDALPGNCPVPMNTPVSFYAYSTSDDKNTGLKVINGFKTKFTPEPELAVPTLWQAFENGIFSAHKKTLADLVDWCAANAKNFNAFFVCDVNVLSKMEEKNSNGTFMITMDDDSLGFADDSKEGEKLYASLTGFLPGMFEPLYKTFAELSRIVIIGAARRDFKKDENGKVETNSKGEKLLADPVVSVWGFDVDPDFIEKPREMDEASEADMEKASGKSEHQDIDDEISDGDLKPSKADASVEEDDDEDDDDDEVEKPKEAAADDEEDAEKPGTAKKESPGEVPDDEIDEILDDEVEEASK